MNQAEAMAFLEPAVPRQRGVWADLGAGSGTFTRALAAILDRGSTIYAVDRDLRATASLRAISSTACEVVPVLGDIRDLERIPELTGVTLDGALLANVLHFLPDPAQVLRAVASRLRSNGRMVVIEYDRRPPSRWVPYPVSPERLRELAHDLGFGPPEIVTEQPSAFTGVMYCAILRSAARDDRAMPPAAGILS